MIEDARDKFYIRVYLTVIAIEANSPNKDGSKLLVKDDGTFPNKFLSKKNTTKDIAVRLLNDYTGVNEDWAIIFPFGVVEDVNPDKDTLTVLYGVFIPEPTRIRIQGSSWKSYSDLNTSEDISEFTKKLALEAVWRQV